jgi:hypothetical protein
MSIMRDTAREVYCTALHYATLQCSALHCTCTAVHGSTPLFRNYCCVQMFESVDRTHQKLLIIVQITLADCFVAPAAKQTGSQGSQ